MIKSDGLYSFFTQFGLDAYPVQAVAQDTVLPYLTYTPIFGDINHPVSVTVNIWERTVDEKRINKRVEEIVERIKRNPIFAYDGGAMLLQVDPGWGQDIPQEIDEALKGKTFNLSVEFISA